MMLKQSSNKINPALNMFKFSLKRNFGIIVLLSLVFLLVCPTYMLTKIGETGAYQTLKVWVYVFPFVSAMVASALVVGLNLLGFSYMFKRSSSDLVDSMPLTRTELFFSKVLSSYVTILIPVLLSNLGIAVTCIARGYLRLGLCVAVGFACEAFAILVVSAISMVFIVCSAGVFDFLVSFAAVNIGLIVIALLIITMFEEFLLGYSGSANGAVIKALSPICLVFMNFYGLAEKESLAGLTPSFFIYSLIFVVVFGVIALLLYKNRKSESNGKAFAYKFMYYICAFVICYCATFGIGAVFAGESIENIIFYPFAIIGAVIIGIAYGAITFRGFKTVKTSVIISLVSAIVLIATMFAVRLDFVGYNKHIPKKEEVEKVEVHFGGNDVAYKDPTIALSMHKKIVEYYSENKDESYYGPDFASVNIYYTLKGKQELHRQYWVSKKAIESEAEKLLTSDERFDQMINSLNKMKKSTFSLTVSSNKYKDGYLGDSYLTYEEAIKLIEIYKKEITDGKHKVITYEDEDDTIYFGSGEYWFGLGFDKTYTETIGFLDELNVEDRVQDFDEKTAIDEVVYD